VYVSIVPMGIEEGVEEGREEGPREVLRVASGGK